MPIIRDGNQARAILQDTISQGKAIPCFCTESVYTTEAIFKGAKAFKAEARINTNLPVFIAFTASYADRQQLKNYTGLSDEREGILAVKADIERLARIDGPYSDIDVMVHLDHAQPESDAWLIEEFNDFICSVMWDCSHYAMEENIRMVKSFVEKYRDFFIIEGAVDEIYNYKSGQERGEVIDNITDPETAFRYKNETGVDLVVANVGTEHRRTAGKAEYHRNTALAISQKIGRRLVLHGTSSLQENEIYMLPKDGMVKVNLWANLEALPGQALLQNLISNIQSILTKEQIQELVNRALLSEKTAQSVSSPTIEFLTEKYRRDDIYLPTVISIVKQFYKYLYY